MVNRVFRGVRVHRIMMRCFLGGVAGEVRNSSIRRAATAKPKPLHTC
jgi:hypothetical protein